MVKGCQKQMIHITNTGSPYFEEAYFVLRKRELPAGTESGDIIKEAVRIAERAARDTLAKKRRVRRTGLVYFLFGAAACSLAFGVAMLIATLI